MSALDGWGVCPVGVGGIGACCYVYRIGYILSNNIINFC